MAVFRMFLLVSLLHATGITLANELILVPGEFRLLALDPDLSAKVSRRGIVDVTLTRSNGWRIHSLRAGVVLAKWYDAAGDLVHSLSIRVVDPKSLRQAFPRWACSGVEMDCDFEQAVIAGSTVDSATWMRVKRDCAMAKRCRFNVELDQSAVDSVRKKLVLLSQTEARHWRIGGTKIGRTEIRFLAACHGQAREQIEQSMGDWAQIVDYWHCEKQIVRRYRIRAKLLAVSKALGNSLGLDVQRKPLVPVSAEKWSIILKNTDNREDLKVVGEPELVVWEGGQAKLQSGGEFRVFYDVSGEEGATKEGWKTFGLQAEVAFLTEWRFGHMMRTKIALVTMTGSETDQLGKHEFTLDVLANPGEYFVGAISMDQNYLASSSQFSLRNIPILGPIFAVTTRQQNHHYLTVWLFIDQLAAV